MAAAVQGRIGAPEKDSLVLDLGRFIGLPSLVQPMANDGNSMANGSVNGFNRSAVDGLEGRRILQLKDRDRGIRADTCLNIQKADLMRTDIPNVKVAGTSGIRTQQVLFGLGRAVGRWADAVEDEAHDTDVGEEEETEEGEVQNVPRAVSALAAVRGTESAVAMLGNRDLEQESLELEEQKSTSVSEHPIRTVIPSPGGSALVGNNGQIEVVFYDVVVVDAATTRDALSDYTMGKKPPGRPAGRGNKKTEARLARLETLRKKGHQ
ncbi:hypothetical protein NE237_007830 [Protea cynaroides]|uniref:Uncharacterized protein n=1 Tax=Protea cynaroides TaxID=273540 RepID=A0A9Q0KQS8_9MAGN|nr:hypothetical protein NE237_007830 [Protea cynaroides]